MKCLSALLLALSNAAAAYASGERSSHIRQLHADSFYQDSSLDDPGQRQFLNNLFWATAGPSWSVPSSISLWNTTGNSYCRWLGVICCASSPFLMVSCQGNRSVVVLNLASLDLKGTLPDAGWAELSNLTALGFADNPQLAGGLPSSLGTLVQLLWMSVLGSSLLACMEGPLSSEELPLADCSLPSFLSFGELAPLYRSDVACPAVLLHSFVAFTARMSIDVRELVALPFNGAGAVICDPVVFFGLNECTCSNSSANLDVDNSGIVTCHKSHSQPSNAYITAIVLVAILPLLIVSLAIYLFIKHKATIHQLIKLRELEWKRKNARIPGTPGVTLHDGTGVLSLADVSVTWVFTDVADSTRLWEWNSHAMDSAIDLHNKTIRGMLDEYCGHEIQNEGDSFALSFHEAADAVRFCLKAQKMLMNIKWPAALLEHESGCKMTTGDLLAKVNPKAAGQGSTIIVGLRVRMGINTGVPNDIFLHDQTGMVDYQGEDYDLAGEICDLAAGGQILMGPQTFQWWNKMYTDAPDAVHTLMMDAYRQEANTIAAPARGDGPPSTGQWGDTSTSGRLADWQRVSRGDGSQGHWGGENSRDWGDSSPLIRLPYGQISRGDGSTYAGQWGDNSLSTRLPELRTTVDSSSMDPGSAVVSVFEAANLGSGTGSPMMQQQITLAGAPAVSNPSSFHLIRESPSYRIPSQLSQVSYTQPLPHSFDQGASGKVVPMQSVNLARQLALKSLNPGVPQQRFSATLAQPSQTLTSSASSSRDPAVFRTQSLFDRNHQSDYFSVDRFGIVQPLGSGSGGVGYRQKSVSMSGIGVTSMVSEAVGFDANVIQNTNSRVSGFPAAIQEGVLQGALLVNQNPAPSRLTPSRIATMDRKHQDPRSILKGQYGPRSALRLPSVGNLSMDGVQRLSPFSVNGSITPFQRKGTATDDLSSKSTALGHSSYTGMQNIRGSMPITGNASMGSRNAHPGYPKCSVRFGMWWLQQQLLAVMAWFSRCMPWLSCMSCVSLASSSEEETNWDAAWKGPRMSALSTTDKSIKAEILDMGYYERRPAEKPLREGTRFKNLYVHLVQIVPSSVAPRVKLFEWPLATGPNWDKVSPGFFDAPGSSHLMLPGMRDPLEDGKDRDRPVVSFAFSSVVGYKELSAFNTEFGQEMLKMHNNCVRETLSACQGYECKEMNGAFMMAFHNSCAAVEWALTLQLALLAVPWPCEVAAHDLVADAWDPEHGELVFHGLRCRVGIFTGSVDRVTPHAKTGRADYFGQPINRAARLMSASHGGQIVCEKGIMETVVEEWEMRYALSQSTGQMVETVASTSAMLGVAPLPLVLLSGVVLPPHIEDTPWGCSQRPLQTDSPALPPRLAVLPRPAFGFSVLHRLEQPDSDKGLSCSVPTSPIPITDSTVVGTDALIHSSVELCKAIRRMKEGSRVVRRSSELSMVSSTSSSVHHQWIPGQSPQMTPRHSPSGRTSAHSTSSQGFSGRRKSRGSGGAAGGVVRAASPSPSQSTSPSAIDGLLCKYFPKSPELHGSPHTLVAGSVYSRHSPQPSSDLDRNHKVGEISGSKRLITTSPSPQQPVGQQQVSRTSCGQVQYSSVSVAVDGRESPSNSSASNISATTTVGTVDSVQVTASPVSNSRFISTSQGTSTNRPTEGSSVGSSSVNAAVSATEAPYGRVDAALVVLPDFQFPESAPLGSPETLQGQCLSQTWDLLDVHPETLRVASRSMPLGLPPKAPMNLIPEEEQPGQQQQQRVCSPQQQQGQKQQHPRAPACERKKLPNRAKSFFVVGSDDCPVLLPQAWHTPPHSTTGSTVRLEGTEAVASSATTVLTNRTSQLSPLPESGSVEVRTSTTRESLRTTPSSVAHLSSQSYQSTAPNPVSAAQTTPTDTNAKHVVTVGSAIIAECFKIRASEDAGQSGHDSMARQPSATPRLDSSTYTHFKYSALRKSDEIQVQESGSEEDGGSDGEAGSPQHVSVPTKVGIWSMGAYRFKGIAELLDVVQVLPMKLKHRLELFNKGSLDEGKARCIHRSNTCIKTIMIHLPDVGSLVSCVYNNPLAMTRALIPTMPAINSSEPGDDNAHFTLPLPILRSAGRDGGLPATVLLSTVLNTGGTDTAAAAATTYVAAAVGAFSPMYTWQGQDASPVFDIPTLPLPPPQQQHGDSSAHSSVQSTFADEPCVRSSFALDALEATLDPQSTPTIADPLKARDGWEGRSSSWRGDRHNGNTPQDMNQEPGGGSREQEADNNRAGVELGFGSSSSRLRMGSDIDSEATLCSMTAGLPQRVSMTSSRLSGFGSRSNATADPLTTSPPGSAGRLAPRSRQPNFSLHSELLRIGENAELGP